MPHSDTGQPLHKVGFITPPAWFDISPTEFLQLAPQTTIVMQTVMRPPEFDYSPDSAQAAVPELTACAQSLAAAGSGVIGQFGFPFSFVHGWKGAQEVQQRIQEATGTPLVMMGVEMILALRHLGCTSVAVASTYYSRQMERKLTSYLDEAGIQVLLCESWQSQGIVNAGEGGIFVGQGELDPMGWKTPEWAVQKAVRSVAAQSPKADCILVTGGGMRLLHLADALEQEIGTTIVAGDLSLYWGLLRRLGVTRGVRGQGRLLSSLT